MKNKFITNNSYLQISLTEKCNLQCVYCKSGNINNDVYDNLSFEDYKFLIKSMSDLGINKVIFTGGEPLLYPRIVELIKFTKNECSIEEIGIITNGILFYEMMYDLKDAGLTKVDISLDTLKEYKFKSVTNGGSLKNILKSIELSIKLGLEVSINCVAIEGFNIDELYDFMLMTNYYPIDVKFRELLPKGDAIKIYKRGYFDIKGFIEDIENVIPKNETDNKKTRYYGFVGAKGRIGIVSPSNSLNTNQKKIYIKSNGILTVDSNNIEKIDIREYLQRPMIFRETMKEMILR